MRANKDDLVFILSFFILSALQLALITCSPLLLSPDEAHYWEWSRHLDWSYYSKGPIVAWMIAAGRSLWGDTEFAIRGPAWFSGMLLFAAFYLLARELYGSRLALIGFFILKLSLLFHFLGAVMTTDPPAMLFWLLTLFAGAKLIRAAEAGHTRARDLWWVAAGIALAFAVLSKYTALILMPSFALFIFLSPNRRLYLSRGTVYGLFFFCLFLIPTIAWNAAHGWVGLLHNKGHLVSQKGISLNPLYLADLIGGQMLGVGPLMVIALTWACVAGLRRFFREHDDLAGFFAIMTVPLFAVCVAVSLTKRIYLNWPMPGWVGALLLLLHLAKYASLPSRFPRYQTLAIFLTGLITVVSYLPILGFTFGINPHLLPTKRVVGWDRMGEEIARILKEKPHLVAVVTDDYGLASLIAFYTPSKPRVFTWNEGGTRMNQYDLWGGWERLHDRDLLIVLRKEAPGPVLTTHFRKVISLEQPLTIDYSGAPLRTFHFLVGKRFNGEPPPTAQRF